MRTQKFVVGCLIAAAFGSVPLLAQSKRTMTPEELSKLTLGTREQQHGAFPPHKIIGNIYYVGTEIQAAFLVATPAGLILINTNFEDTVPLLRAAVEKLGFRFEDIKIVLGSHAHADHMEGDALVKQLTSARVMAMAEDVPALERIRPAGKLHPIDQVLHDGDEVSLGGTTLVAHLTAGHTPGDTTWTMRAEEGGRSYAVVILGGMGSTDGQTFATAAGPTPLAAEYIRSFKFLRSIPCDVPLGSHAPMYNMTEKYARIGKGPNPFIDHDGCLEELDARERVFNFRLNEQKKGAAKSF
jgi:metallo-beta-lactamase class B